MLLKYGVTKAAIKYHTNRQFVYRQLKKYKDDDPRFLALKSRKPKKHPNQHTKKELDLIKITMDNHGADYGLADLYMKLKKLGYKRSYGSMCRQIRNKISSKKSKMKKSYVKFNKVDGMFPGDKAQIDIKYIPRECIKFGLGDSHYYQITAIDEFSRKRVLSVCTEKVRMKQRYF